MNINYNKEYDTELIRLVTENKYGYYGKLNKCKDIGYLAEYVKQCTQFLDETEIYLGKKFITWAMRVFYTLKHIDHQLTCCVCGKPYIISKYFSIIENYHIDINHLHCCHLCAMNDPRTQQRITDTFMDHYGCKSCFQAEQVKRKIEDTNEERYGTRQFLQSKRYLEIGEANDWWPETEGQRKHRGEVLKQTFAKKTKEEKQQIVLKTQHTKLKRYGSITWVGSEQYWQWRNANPEIEQLRVSRGINTKIKNKTSNSSKSELTVFERLKEIFGTNDVLIQYRSELYPFACDFYIPSIDLYIECNFHWTHGCNLGFFDCCNNEHLKLLEKWKSRMGTGKKDFYYNAIKTWTVRDPLKAQTAINNNLHYLVFWNLREAEDWINSADPNRMRREVNNVI